MANVKLITSRDNPLLVRLRKLAADPSAYRKLGDVWIEGDHLCSAYLQRGGAASQAVITQAAWDSAALRRLASRAAAVAVVPQTVMASLSRQANPLDIIGVFRQRIRDEMPLPAAGDVWVGLDTMRDPGNLGTIIRTADAIGAAGVVLIGQSCDPWSPESVRATMGSIFAVPLIAVLQPMLFLAACLAAGGLMTFVVQAAIRRRRPEVAVAA